MSRRILVGLLALMTLSATTRASAQDAQAARKDAFTFESSGSAAQVVGWHQGPAGTVFLDSVEVHGGRYAGRLQRDAGSDGTTSVLTLAIPVTFSGATVELSGWLKTQDVQGFAGLWLREDGETGPVQFDNMQSRKLAGTTEWTRYTIRLPVDKKAKTLYLGALLAGEGTVWVDDLDLLVDGVPPEQAPPFVHVPTAVESDTEFDAGSGIPTQPLSAVQIENLATLAKVWGFAKYRHPRITGGQVNWDYELFRIMPELLRARDRATADRAMSAWLERLGNPEPCDPCARAPVDPYLAPEIAWIHDTHVLGPELSSRLDLIEQRRQPATDQYYVSLNRGVGNPEFGNEVSYRTHQAPDAGFRMLALFRYWNIIEYWYPNRDVIGEDWSGVLKEFVPRFMSAQDPDAYRLTMMQLIARIHDTHANLWSDLRVRPPMGTAQLPVIVRFVEGKAVVTGYLHPTLGPATGLRIGDVIEGLDGARVDSLVHAWRPYYADSNEAARLRDIAATLTRGAEGPVRVRGERADGPFELTARRAPLSSLDRTAGRWHDLPGPAFQMLTDDVAYLKLSAVKMAESADYIRRAASAKVLVVDIRNYPREFVVFTLGGHLVSHPTSFVRFTRGDLSNPGAFEWRPRLALQPLEPHFAGKVVILVDEVTQSSAEYTTMAFRTDPNALVVGSTTAGADGNVSSIPLPGGLSTMISGIGVFYPDGKPTQRVGIEPDLVVRPTIAGIRAGRDEVLETAVSRALGTEFRLSER